MIDAEWMTPLELEDLSFPPESLTCFTGWGSLQIKKRNYGEKNNVCPDLGSPKAKIGPA